MLKIRVGVSHCLLGEEVRYDGGHKKDPFLTETLGMFFEWVPVCPEVEAGMGVPRESVQLVESGDGVRMVGVRSRIDFTDQMTSFSSLRIPQLKNLSGFIFKKGSPSCGVVRVRIHSRNGIKNGSGMFAGTFTRNHPLIPVEEEGRLHDPALRENFIERVFCYHRLSRLLEDMPTPQRLMEFHMKHKMILLSHSPELYRQLGRLSASAGRDKNFGESLQQYGSVFMHALQFKATRGKHANVLSHLLGHLKKLIERDEKAELIEIIDQYRKGLVPLIVPVTLLKHHFRRRPVSWVQDQHYLNPYPAELMLRNHG